MTIPTSTNRPIFTMLDARQERIDAEAESETRMDAADAEAKRIAGLLTAYPTIGQLIRCGFPIYYARNGATTLESGDIDEVVEFLNNPEPAGDPLDDFNYVGSRHHY